MLKSAEKIIIITERIICSRIIEYLESLGIKAYTIYQDVSGQGERGMRSITGGLWNGNTFLDRNYKVCL